MDRAVAYLKAIEEINVAERRIARLKDERSLLLRQSALDAARAAWLALPEEWQAKLEPPPDDLL